MPAALSRCSIGPTPGTERPVDPTDGPPGWPAMDGYIGDARVSSTNRYAANFVPDRRLLPDASTIALWHLDEGKGDIALDSGPNHLNGAIIERQRVTAPAR